MDENKEKKDISIDLKTDNYDPLIKVKKIITAIIVIAMVVAMIIVFASFHWLYIEHTRYISNKSSLDATFLKRQKEIENDIRRYENERELAFQEIALLNTNDIPNLKSKKAELEAAIIKLIDISNEVSQATIKHSQLKDDIEKIKTDIGEKQKIKDNLDLQINEENLAKSKLIQTTNALNSEIASLISATNKFTEKLKILNSEIEKAENDRDIAKKTLEIEETSKKGIIKELNDQIEGLRDQLKQQEADNQYLNINEAKGDN